MRLLIILKTHRSFERYFVLVNFLTTLVSVILKRPQRITRKIVVLIRDVRQKIVHPSCKAFLLFIRVESNDSLIGWIQDSELMQ